MSLYAGFDCSTQSFTVVVIDTKAREVAYRHAVRLEQPWIAATDPSVVHTVPRVWRDALDRVLGSLARHVDVSRLQAMSGSAQQHGSVYCGVTPDILTRSTSPIWMDSSTTRECEEIERTLGGPSAVAHLTGSRAFPRFTGPQIRKFAREEPQAYQQTERIHLVSSYLASVLTGTHAPIDHADGSGMNLMDIRTRQWSPQALEATASGLQHKLPSLVASATKVGTLSLPTRRRFSLPSIAIVAWSGDNPCSLIGTGLLEEGQLAISLGTSDTIFGPMNEPRVSPDGTGHVFASPQGTYMGITVFRNGSLARERIRDQFGMTWEGFSEALRQTPPGNDGASLLPWFEPEITPHVGAPVVHRFGLDNATPARHVRAIVEAQAMALARHSAWMGVVPRTIYATGGAAANREVLQVVADVFDARVFRFEATDSAALGAALRAYQAETCLPWSEVVDGFVAPRPDSVISPRRQYVDVYGRLRPIYAAREAEALAHQRSLPAATPMGTPNHE